MNKITAVHCGDIHYDSDVSHSGMYGGQRRRERQQSFEDIVKMCLREHIGYLLIAGDLFDAPEPEKKYADRLRDIFGQCKDTNIFISPGNHDYVTAFSPYGRIGYWSDNVHIFKNRWEYEIVEEDGVCVWGGAFCAPHENRSLLGKCPENGYINIGVLHGDIRTGSLYNPITYGQIEESGLDYLALGHIHQRTPVSAAGNTYYAYSGCHDGRGFDETGECGVYAGSIWHGGCSMKFVPASSRRYLKMRIDISDMHGDEETAGYIEENLSGDEEDLYSVTLYGNVCGEYEPDLRAIEEMMNVFYCKISAEYTKMDYENIAPEDTVRGEFVRRMLEEGDELALELGLRAFESDVGYYED